jgi:hypothetical protein
MEQLYVQIDHSAEFSLMFCFYILTGPRQSVACTIPIARRRLAKQIRATVDGLYRTAALCTARVSGAFPFFHVNV